MSRFIIKTLIGIIGIILFFVLSGFFFTKNTKPLVKADVIIVLGSPSLKNGKPSKIQRSRVDEGLVLFEKGLAPKLLFTGGAAWNGAVESETMKKYALSKGINSKDILVETKSTNTDENAAFSYEILQKHELESVIVVSSSFHTRRANFLFSHYPLQVQTRATPYPYNMKWKNYIFAIANEYYGFLRYYVT